MGIFKEEKEIQNLREGGKRLAEILQRLTDEAKPGVSPKSLDDLARDLAKKAEGIPSFLGYSPRGASRPFPAAICVSVNEELVHGIPNEGRGVFEEGDVVGLDMGLTYEGLITDSTVTVGIGETDEQARELIAITEKALDAGIAAVRAGARVGDIGHAIESVVEKTSFSVVPELGGHGVGRSVHEEPYVPSVGGQGEGPVLRAGEVIAIEPILTEGSPKIKILSDGYTYVTRDGSRSAEFEHTVLVKEDGAEILTKV